MRFVSRTLKSIHIKLKARAYLSNLKGKKGLEIGGPSAIFKDNGPLPIYNVLSSLDGCNFAENTIWEGKIKEGWNYRYLDGKEPGYQYICDAVDLAPIKSNSYDVILSSHNIEHLANPFKAIAEWIRVLKDGGLLLLVVPHKDRTFDHKRPITTLEHLVEDFRREIGEGDMTHLKEILELHDFEMTPEIADQNAFKSRSLNNASNRCLHHHVFDTELVLAILNYFDFKVISHDFMPPFNIVTLAICTKLALADKLKYL